MKRPRWLPCWGEARFKFQVPRFKVSGGELSLRSRRGSPLKITRKEERLPDTTMDQVDLPHPISDRFLALEQELIELRKKLENPDSNLPR